MGFMVAAIIVLAVVTALALRDLLRELDRTFEALRPLDGAYDDNDTGTSI